jgi:hypothetical protein
MTEWVVTDGWPSGKLLLRSTFPHSPGSRILLIDACRDKSYTALFIPCVHGNQPTDLISRSGYCFRWLYIRSEINITLVSDPKVVAIYRP